MKDCLRSIFTQSIMKSPLSILELNFKVLVLYLFKVFQIFVKVTNSRLITFDVVFQAHYVHQLATYISIRFHCLEPVQWKTYSCFGQCNASNRRNFSWAGFWFEIASLLERWFLCFWFCCIQWWDSCNFELSWTVRKTRLLKLKMFRLTSGLLLFHCF